MLSTGGWELPDGSPCRAIRISQYPDPQYDHFLQENVQNHNYASDPLEWPLLTRGIAYFISKESNAQVP